MPPPPEALGLMLDVSGSLSAAEFAAVRDLAFRIARKRLFVGAPAANGDKVAVFALGSDVTRNAFAEREGTGWAGLEQVSPAGRLGIDVLRRIQAVVQGAGEVNFADAFDVALDHLVERAGKARVRKRGLLITKGKGYIAKDRDACVNELTSVAHACLQSGVTIDVVFVDGLLERDWDGCDEEEDDSEVDEENDRGSDCDLMAVPEQGGEGGEGDDGARQLLAAKARVRRLFSGARIDASFTRRKRVHTAAAAARDHKVPRDSTLLRQTLLARLARALGGADFTVDAASRAAEAPWCKPKKATVKFHGVLDIGGGLVGIPVKTYSRVGVETRPASTLLAWASSVALRRPIRPDVVRRYVPENDVNSGTAVEDDDIADAYPYGPDLAVIDDEVVKYSMDLACEKSFSLIAFVPQSKVPVSLFLGSVDVVLPMSGPEKCGPLRAVEVLAKAMTARDCGAIARLVTGKGSASKPDFVYLWPAVERVRDAGRGHTDESVDELEAAADGGGEDTAAGRSGVWYFNMVRIATRHDVRKFPFASLKPKADAITADEQAFMDRFVAARDLDADVVLASRMESMPPSSSAAESEDDQVPDAADAEEQSPFDPAAHCNPALDRFFRAIVTRALEGGAGTSGLAEPAAWAKVLMDPGSALRKNNVRAARAATEAVKNAFALTAVEPEEAKRIGRAHLAMASGAQLDTAHLYPSHEVEEEGEDNAARPPHHRGERDEVDGPEYGDAAVFGPPLVPGPAVLDAGGDDAAACSDESDGVLSAVTADCPVVLSTDRAVRDMLAMIRARRGLEAIELMSDVIYRAIREGDLVLAAECFTAFRSACAKLLALNSFNHLFERIVRRARNVNAQGNAAAAFVRHMRRDEGTGRVLAALYPKDAARRRDMTPSIEEMRAVAADVEHISRSAVDRRGAAAADGTSALTGTAS